MIPRAVRCLASSSKTALRPSVLGARPNHVLARAPVVLGQKQVDTKRWSSNYVHLGDLAGNQGSSKPNVRLGRGWSSTKGGTSGRGHKGQKARAGNGKPKAGFEGGQTPITRLFPKRGFTNVTSKSYAPLSIDKLQLWIAQGRLDPSEVIDVGMIFQSDLVHGIKGWSGVKLLGEVDPTLPLPPLKLRLSRYSKGAARAVIEAGGELTAVYHNVLALRQAAHPEKFFGREVKEAAPIRKTDILYYSNPAKHGFMAKETAASSAPASLLASLGAGGSSIQSPGVRAFSTSARRMSPSEKPTVPSTASGYQEPPKLSPVEEQSSLKLLQTLAESTEKVLNKPSIYNTANEAPVKERKSFQPNRLYAPHDFLASSLYPTKKRGPKPPLLGPSAKAAKLSDPFHILGVNPVDEVLNRTLVDSYISQMGKIKTRAETGLTWKNQRRVGKMVRRARAMGIIGRWRNEQAPGPRKSQY